MATELEAYLRQAAAARGIDPDVVVRVAKGEGGLSDPFRRGAGPAPRSQAPGLGATENSYGPLQLYVSGTGAGLGDRAMAAGIDPSKNWQGGVDFALDEVKRKGWGQWYGAKAQGITGMMGVGGGPTMSPGAADFVKNNPQPGGFGLPVEQAAGLAPATQQQPGGILADLPAGTPQHVADYWKSLPDDGSEKQSPLQALFASLAKMPAADPVRFSQMGDARATGDSLLKAVNAPKFADLLKQKRMG